jgi:hypothetical protein
VLAAVFICWGCACAALAPSQVYCDAKPLGLVDPGLEKRTPPGWGGWVGVVVQHTNPRLVLPTKLREKTPSRLVVVEPSISIRDLGMLLAMR